MIRVAALLLGAILLALCSRASADVMQPYSADGQYVIIGWNDLGMHCINPRFRDICLLPPANNINAVVIRRGEEPRLVTQGISVTYVLPTNRHVELNTNFWRFAPRIFDTSIAPGVGITGNRTAGPMAVNADHFQATAVPAIPVSDDRSYNPYQTARLKLFDGAGKMIARTTIVVPVSDEMNCQKCHATGQIAARGIKMPTVEQNILRLHDLKANTNLMDNRPVLCSSCHADAALGQAGQPNIRSLSFVMHRKHASLASQNQPTCYDCHPGQRTQCSRSAIVGMGPQNRTDPGCVLCHGSLNGMRAGLRAGRQPWLQEPTCAQCHGAAYSTGTLLYRNAHGHGGIQCVVCHNSPHAWWPSLNNEDNAQPVALQRSTKPLGFKACNICHTDGRSGSMPPHGGDD